MIDLLVAGNLLFTVPLTLVAVAVMGFAASALVAAGRGRDAPFRTRMVFHLGLFAFVFGLFSQTIGLYQMMAAVERVGNVSPAIVAGGLKVSLITPVYGLGIFVAALLLRLAVESLSRTSRRARQDSNLQPAD